MVTAVRTRLPPQDQRKELSGSEGKGNQPCMEENELYSSAAVGEGVQGGCFSAGCFPQGVVGMRPELLSQRVAGRRCGLAGC